MNLIDYSKWDKITFSDDEEELPPPVELPSLNKEKIIKVESRPFPEKFENDPFLSQSMVARTFWNERNPKFIPYPPRELTMTKKEAEMMQEACGDWDPHDHWIEINEKYKKILELEKNGRFDDAYSLRENVIELYKDGI